MHFLAAAAQKLFSLLWVHKKIRVNRIKLSIQFNCGSRVTEFSTTHSTFSKQHLLFPTALQETSL